MSDPMADVIVNVVNRRASDQTTKHIGYVGCIPTVGERLSVLQFERDPRDPTKATIRPIRRASTPVVKAEPIDGQRLWKELTMSGREYFAEVMFQFQ